MLRLGIFPVFGNILTVYILGMWEKRGGFTPPPPAGVLFPSEPVSELYR